MTTAGGIDYVRTPDSCFADLPDWRQPQRVIELAGIGAMALDKCYPNPQGKLQVFCNNMPGKWHTMGVTLAAGGSLRWVRDMLGGAENEVARWLGKDVYELFAAEAAMAEPGSEGLIFLPYLIGERCPHPDPNARGGFIGLTLRHDRRYMLRSVLEGAIFSLKGVTHLIEDLGIRVNQIRTSGGGARRRRFRARAWPVPDP